MTRLTAGISALALLSLSFSVSAQEKDERAGTCEDAKAQMAYFCDPARKDDITMVMFGTACDNAKKNVAAACEGKIEADKAYEFEKGQ